MGIVSHWVGHGPVLGVSGRKVSEHTSKAVCAASCAFLKKSVILNTILNYKNTLHSVNILPAFFFSFVVHTLLTKACL